MEFELLVIYRGDFAFMEMLFPHFAESLGIAQYNIENFLSVTLV